MVDGEGLGRRDRTNTHNNYPGRRSQRIDSELPPENRSRTNGSHGKLPYRPRQLSDQHSRSGYPERRQSRISNRSSENEANYDRYSSGTSGSYRKEPSYNEDNGEGPSIGRNRSKRSPSKRPDTRRGLTKVHETSGDSFASLNGETSVPRNAPRSEPPRRPVVVQYQTTTDMERIPYLSVGVVAHWKVQEKSQTGFGLRSWINRLSSPPNILPHNYLRKGLKERDHVYYFCSTHGVVLADF